MLFCFANTKLLVQKKELQILIYDIDNKTHAPPPKIDNKTTTTKEKKQKNHSNNSNSHNNRNKKKEVPLANPNVPFPGQNPSLVDTSLNNLQLCNQGVVSSEAWNQVSMIAPVKKFGRARLSTGLWKRNIFFFFIRFYVKQCLQYDYETYTT